jgi:rubrerythrin
VFDEFIREIKRLDIKRGVKIPIHLPLDDKAYLDRRCPHHECSADFKVLFADWREKVPNEAASCPKCGKRTKPDKFNTPAQRRYIQQTAKAYAAKQLQGALKRAAGRTRPRTIGGGLFSVQMSVSYRAGALPVMLPIEAADILRQDFQCDLCGCRYSTIGAGYFCPACGQKSAIKDFEQTIATTLNAVDALDDIRNSLASKYDADAAADVSVRLWGCGGADSLAY